MPYKIDKFCVIYSLNTLALVHCCSHFFLESYNLIVLTKFVLMLHKCALTKWNKLEGELFSFYNMSLNYMRSKILKLANDYISQSHFVQTSSIQYCFLPFFLGDFKIFLKSSRSSPSQMLFLIVVIKKRLQRRCFPVKFVKYIRKPFFKKWLLLRSNIFFLWTQFGISSSWHV